MRQVSKAARNHARHLRLQITPLLYGKQNMGVLALGNGPMTPPFTQSDFIKSLQIDREAVPLSLYNAIIYSSEREKAPRPTLPDRVTSRDRS